MFLWLSNPPSMLRMGLLLYAQGVSDRWQRRQGQKWKRSCGWYNYLYSVSYLTLTAGDKGIKCPSVSPKQCRKGPSGTPPLAMMANLSAPLATTHRWLHSLLPRVLGRVLERHVSRCAGARARSGGFPRQAPCRGRRLVAFGSLSLAGSCRDAGRVAASFLGMP